LSLPINTKKLKIYLIFFLVFSPDLFPQEYLRELNGIPVHDAEGIIPNTFSGGINNLEYQFIDIDGDGDLDLFYLDSDGTFGLYKNVGTAESPNFVLSFDTIPGLSFSNWFYFVDINADRKYDLFTGGAANYIEFRKNIGTFSSPFFELAKDTLFDSDGQPIFSEFASNPMLFDVDTDGDFDFISGNSIGTLTFYENIGTQAEFNFKFISNFWQDIIIIGGAKPAESEHHGASALDMADIDNDGDLDLFWGDFFSRSLYFLRNDGTPAEPNINLLYTAYPQNSDSVQTSGFNMPRLVDIDNDGDLDLFVSVLYDPTVPQSLIFYENIGSAETPDLRKITENYLKTLDVGTQSVPVFADIDNDGDLDLFIGSAKNPNGTLYYFENTGSNSSAEYFLRDSAFFGIQGELSIAPAFGDLDGDGDLDLLIGNFDGTIGLYNNQGTPDNPDFHFAGNLRSIGDTIIDIGIYARPYLIDIDDDGDLDLAVGGFNGRFTFYKNTGTPQQYIFERNNDFFGTLDIGDNSSPFLMDYDGDGNFDLFTGSRTGNIFYFRNAGNNISPVWQLITDNFLGQNFGGDAVITFADIDDDTYLDIFIGNVKGGLYFYRNQTAVSIRDEKTEIFLEDFAVVEAYPNPFNPDINIIINLKYFDDYQIKIYNLLGQEVKTIYSGKLLPDVHHFKWNGLNQFENEVPSGTYFVSINGSSSKKSIKIMLQK
jgi:hypothetical protein